MTVVMTAGPPLEQLAQPVGRSIALLVDSERDDRALGVDCWYPAIGGDHAASVYELLPGIGFTASALADAPAAPGRHPLVIWSHGQSGTRSSYAMLCESLASRGYVVLATDHPGDTLADWLLGVQADEATNERQRVADLRFVLDAALGARPELELAPEIDTDRIAVAGHSYGAWTAFSVAGAKQTDPRVRAAAGLQSFTRTIPAKVFGRIDIPLLLVTGACDETTPPVTDADPAFAALAGKRALRVDVESSGHQGCSDVGLYLELAPQVEGLPDIVGDYLQSLAIQVTGRVGDPWRPNVGLHARVLGAWLDETFDRGADQARRDLETAARTPGVTMRDARG